MNIAGDAAAGKTARERDSELLKRVQQDFVQINYDKLAQQNYVTNELRRNPAHTSFMLMLAASACVKQTYYHPAFPGLKTDDAGVENQVEQTAELISLKKTLREIVRTVSDNKRVQTDPAYTSPSAVMDTMCHRFPFLKDCTSDEDIVRKGGVEGVLVHRFLCFTLNFHNLFVYPYEFARGVYIFRVRPSTILKRKRRDDDSAGSGAPQAVVVFHGTHTDRLYSLIRNGAHTLNVVHNGRACGHGFYCSKSFTTATCYSDGFVGVYVLRNPGDHVPGARGRAHASNTTTWDENQVFVVTKSEDLVLSCVLHKHASPAMIEKAKEFARANMQEEEEEQVDAVQSSSSARRQLAPSMQKGGETAPASSPKAPRPTSGAQSTTASSSSAATRAAQADFHSSPTANKRLMVEMKHVLKKFSDEGEACCKPDERTGIRVKVDENNVHRWLVTVRNFPDDSALERDMRAYNVREIRLEAQFPTDYPFQPPFVRVLRPRFVEHTGHVTQRGALCAKFLTNSSGDGGSWSPTVSLEILFIMIKDLLCQNGRLAPGGTGQYGNAAEAKESFMFNAKLHGWNP